MQRCSRLESLVLDMGHWVCLVLEEMPKENIH